MSRIRFWNDPAATFSYLHSWAARIPQQAKRKLEELAALPIGTAWTWSPGRLDLFKRVAVRRRRMSDSSSTPKAGQRAAAPRAFAEVDLEQLRAKMTETEVRARM